MNSKLFTFIVFSVLWFTALPGFCYAAPSVTEDLRKAVDISLAAEGTPVGDYTLVDQDGVKFHLSDYFNVKNRAAKPLVVSFIYTSCPDVCPTITADLNKAAQAVLLKYGRGFNLLNIGFDPANDTTAKLKEYGSRFTRDFSGNRFATADVETIKKLAARFGFYYSRNADGSFDHIDMVSVVRSDGVIYRQVYGVRTDAGLVEERAAELIAGKPPADSTSLIDRVKFFCYRYDPSTGRYVIDYAVFAGTAIQAVIIGAIIWFVWGARIRGRFKRAR